jgi:nucleoside-diphosphate kinase
MIGTYTLTMIKPDVFASADQLIQRISFEGFKTIGMKVTMLTPDKAAEFYAVHKSKDFYDDLIKFMTSGPIVAIALQKTNAIEDFRTLIGDTDPKAANPGTIRSMYGSSIASNAIHGSDSDENALTEVSFFFPELIDKTKRIQ